MPVKDTIYVDTTKQVIIYLPLTKVQSTSDTLETNIVEVEKTVDNSNKVVKIDEGEKETITQEVESNPVEVSQEALMEVEEKILIDAPENVPLNESSQSALKVVEEKVVDQERVDDQTIDRSVEESNLEDNSEIIAEVKDVSTPETKQITAAERDYEMIHKTNRILVWRLIKRFMYYSDQKYDLSTGMNKSMENYRDLFQNNAVIYHDLMKSPEHVDYRDYFDDVSEYFDNVKIDQNFEDVWLIYNRLFQSDLAALETESNYSDDDQSSFYYELPIKKFVSNKIGNDGKIIQLEKPEEYNLRFKILVDYQQLEARIAGIYLN